MEVKPWVSKGETVAAVAMSEVHRKELRDGPHRGLLTVFLTGLFSCFITWYAKKKKILQFNLSVGIITLTIMSIS